MEESVVNAAESNLLQQKGESYIDNKKYFLVWKIIISSISIAGVVLLFMDGFFTCNLNISYANYSYYTNETISGSFYNFLLRSDFRILFTLLTSISLSVIPISEWLGLLFKKQLKTVNIVCSTFSAVMVSIGTVIARLTFDNCQFEYISVLDDTAIVTVSFSSLWVSFYIEIILLIGLILLSVINAILKKKSQSSNNERLMKMKKIVSITLVLLLIISLCSCKKKQSGITIENFYKNAIKQIDKDLMFNVKETIDGFSFQFTDDSSTKDIEYSGKADKEKNINLITVKTNDINVKYFYNCTAAEVASILNNWSKLTAKNVYKLDAVLFLMNLTYILNVFSYAETEEEKEEDLTRLFAARFSEQEINGWKILITTNEKEGSVTFTAMFDD